MSTGNTKYGNNALENNTTPNGYNSAFGTYALQSSLEKWNTAVGGNSGRATTSGISNTSVGVNTLLKNTIGNYNTALGTAALLENIDGDNNTAIGTSSLINNTYGEDNVAIGIDSLMNNTLGSENTSIGSYAMGYQTNIAGSENTAIGVRAGFLNYGNRNTFLGAKTDSTSNLHNNSTAIGYEATITDDHQIKMGTVFETVVVPGQLTVTGPIIAPSISGTAGSANNIVGGANQIPYQSALNTTTFIPNETIGKILTSTGLTSAPTWQTNFAGTAAIASQVTLSNTASGATNYLVMSATNSGTASLLTDSSGATYDSTTNTADIDISGNATTVTVTVDDSATTYYPTFTNSGTGQKSLLFDTSVTTPLSYVPSTSTLTASTFSGDLNGTATNATNATNAAFTLSGDKRPIAFNNATTGLSGNYGLLNATTYTNNCFIDGSNGKFFANDIEVTNGNIESPSGTDLQLKTDGADSVLLQPNGVTTLEANSIAIVHKKNTTLPVGESAPVEKLQLGGTTAPTASSQSTHLAGAYKNLATSGVLPAGTYLFIGQSNFECTNGGDVSLMGSSFSADTISFPGLSDQLAVSTSTIAATQTFTSVGNRISFFSSSCVVNVASPTTYYFNAYWNIAISSPATFDSSGQATFTRIA